MRADVSDVLKVGDLVTVPDGPYAGLDGEVVEVVHVIRPWAGRARLRLPWPRPDHWHPFWSDPMDEAEWLTTRDTSAMERFLAGRDPPPARRKWLLYGCACVRRVWDVVPDEFRAALDDLEETANDPPGLVRPLSASLQRRAERTARADAAAKAVLLLLPASPPAATRALPFAHVRGYAWRASPNYHEPDVHRELLRDVFGNPFRPVALDPAWLAWQHGLVGALARQIYDGRRFDEMPVLADALEDAGCRDEGILSHLRSPLHSRGCHLLDALLGSP